MASTGLRQFPPTVRITAERFGPEKANLTFGSISTSHMLGAAAAALGGGISRTEFPDLPALALCRRRRLCDRRRSRADAGAAATAAGGGRRGMISKGTAGPIGRRSRHRPRPGRVLAGFKPQLCVVSRLGCRSPLPLQTRVHRRRPSAARPVARPGVHHRASPSSRNRAAGSRVLGLSAGGVPAAHSAATPNRREVAMTHGALHVSAIALGAAAFISISPLSTASAGTRPRQARRRPHSVSRRPRQASRHPRPAERRPRQARRRPHSVSRRPRPSLAMAPQRPSHVYVGHHARHTHYAWRHGHRYATYDRNPVAAARHWSGRQHR